MDTYKSCWREEDAPAAAHQQSWQHLFGEADARREVGVVGVVESAVSGGAVYLLARELQANGGADGIDRLVVEVCLAVVPFGEGRLELPAQTEVERESGGGLVVVLRIEADIVLLGRGVEGVGGRAAIGCADQQGSEPIAWPVDDIGALEL